MSRYALTSLILVLVFLGIWFARASSFGIYGDETFHLSWAEGIARTGSCHFAWDTALDQPIPKDLKENHGLLPTYLFSLSFHFPVDHVLWSRFVCLIFTLATYGTILYYFRRRGMLTAQRLFVWTALFFGSAVILDLSYYIRTYAILGTATALILILYWEGLMRLQQNQRQACIRLWALGMLLFLVTVIDQWQIEQIPALVFGVLTGILYLDPQHKSLLNGFKKWIGWILWGLILFSPLLIQNYQILKWIKLQNTQVFIPQHHSSFWDNLVGWLRFVLGINVGLLSLDWALRSMEKLSFDRWIFINGLFTAIVCLLYNSVLHVFFPKYVYLPLLMMLIGWAGFWEDFLKQTKLKSWALVLYLLVNGLMSWVNVYEHSNVGRPIHWLHSHLDPHDVLLVSQVNDDILRFEGRGLLSRAHTVDPSQNMQDITDLKQYIAGHAQGKIYYLYVDHYAFRRWLCLMTIGKDLYPPIDLFAYLRDRIPSSGVMPGLRQCGLMVFDRTELLNGLDHLLQQGFETKPSFHLRQLWRHFFKY